MIQNKENETNLKLYIEIFWSSIVGILFSMAPLMFRGYRDKSFDLGRWWREISNLAPEYSRYHSVEGAGDREMFLFGFILAMLVIYSIKKYKDCK
jgi:hypothetical protein